MRTAQDIWEDKIDQHMDEAMTIVDKNFGNVTDSLIGFILGILIAILSIPCLLIVSYVLFVICSTFGI